MSNVRRKVFFATLLLTTAASAQYGGGCPPGQYPGGGYPGRYPGQYPGGIGGIPFPRRGKQTKTTTQKDQPVPLQKVTGRLQSLDGGAVTVLADDRRTVSAKLSDTTKFYGKMTAPSASSPKTTTD